MHGRGLRNRAGGNITLNGLSTILNNPFYIGVIRLRKTGEHFSGIHEPLVDRQIFDIVQLVLEGKTVPRRWRHEFVYSRMIRCDLCQRTIMAEVQKGHTYYRCHTRACATKTIREEIIEDSIARAFSPLCLSGEEISYVRQWFVWKRSRGKEERDAQLQACNLHLSQIQDRLGRLTDAYIDQAISRAMLDERRAKLLMEEADVKRRIGELEAGKNTILERAEKFLELVKTAPELYKTAIVREKREMVKALTSNLTVGPKYAAITLNGAAQLLVNRPKTSDGGPNRGIPRTLDRLLEQLVSEFEERSESNHPLMEPIHNRMPVILKPSDYDRWLTREQTAQPPVDLLCPYDSDQMEAHPVDPRVGNVRNNEPGLCERWACPSNSA